LGDYDIDGSGGNCDEDSQAGTQIVDGCKGTSNLFRLILGWRLSCARSLCYS
jgi:hypothetical protein